MATENNKLLDEEKTQLLSFYRENTLLWSSENPYYHNKARRISTKEKLAELFEGKYSLEVLEKTFHSLRTSYAREVKKEVDGILPKKKWRFMDEMQFLKEELSNNNNPSGNKKTVKLNENESEMLIDFYKSNPSLWNHNLTEYRDRNLRNVLMQKLCSEIFDDKFKEEELKRFWHNLVTTYKREKQREEASACSGSGTSDLYTSSWEHFTTMTFIDVTNNTDESVSTLDEGYQTTLTQPPQKRKRNALNEEQTAKAELWKVLAAKIGSSSTSENFQPQKSTSSMTSEEKLRERANIFGRTVVDSLMQCEPHHWPMLKKRIMDLFYEYENFRSQPQQPNMNQNMMQNPYYHQNYNFSPGSVSSNHSNESFQ